LLLFVPHVFAADGDNTAPVASAVGPVTVAQNSSVLIGLSATDADGDLLTFSVSQPSHGVVTGSTSAAGVSVTYTPEPDYSGNDSFTFVVSDGLDVSSPVTIDITISAPANTAPVALAAGPITTAHNAESVPITLTGTDSENDSLTYLATAPSNGTLSSLGGDTPGAVTYTPNANFTGDDSFTFTVSDGVAISAAQTVGITVSTPANIAPTASFTSLTSDLQVTFTSTSTDSDGSIEAYEWDFGDGTSKGAGATTTHTYPAGNYTASLVVTDDKGETSKNLATAQITAIAASPPSVAKIAVNPGLEVPEVTEVTLDGSASTGEGTLVYDWIQNPNDKAQVTLPTDIAQVTFIAPKVGLAGMDLNFTLTVTDSNSSQSKANVKITVNNNPALNVTPLANAGSVPPVDQGNEVILRGENSSDEDGDETIESYTWTQHPEDLVRVTLVNDPATPNATFIAPAVVKDDAPNGVYILRFELVVTDNEGAKSESARVVVNVVLGDGKSLPVADAGSDQAVAQG
ncbi:MAG: tandem-95 repeat protein, partial [Methylococcales bacterium]|nr:tandem-95 repeat protein [Methylococcales bacterium]